MLQNYRENMIKEPSNKMMGGSIWIWKEPVIGHKYIMGVDVSRGDSEDFSSIQIIDFDEREQVLEYVGKMPPDTLAEICYKWGNMYSAFIVIDITIDPNLIDDFVQRVSKLTLESSYKVSHNFKIDKNHKEYETIIFVKTINWLSEIEKKYLNIVPNIDMLSITENNFDNLKKICKITNISVLNNIINDYNRKQSINLNIFPESIKKYIKKYKNQV
jgi:hypothetical protein